MFVGPIGKQSGRKSIVGDSGWPGASLCWRSTYRRGATRPDKLAGRLLSARRDSLGTRPSTVISLFFSFLLEITYNLSSSSLYGYYPRKQPPFQLLRAFSMSIR